MILSRLIPLDRVKEAFGILPSSTKRRLLVVALVQAALSTFDLIALFLVGSLGSLAVTGIQSSSPAQRDSIILEVLGLENESFQRQIAILGSITALLLIVKTVSSAYLNFRIFFFMSTVSAQISSALLSRYVNMTYLDIKKRSSQETLQALTSGVSSMSNGIVGNFVSLVGDIFLLTVMILGVSSIDPKVGFFTLFFFGTIALFTYRYTSRASSHIASTLVVENIFSNNLVLTIIRTFREISTRGLLGSYSAKIRNTRYRISRLEANQAFVPFVTKYVMELTLIIGGLLLTAIQFATEDAPKAISGIAVFILASSRISPAILRFQQALLQVKAAVAGSLITFGMLKELEGKEELPDNTVTFSTNHNDFNAQVNFTGVQFSYPESKELIFDSLDIKIENGEIISIVGPSGSGKTSFADLVLGQLEPNKGQVTVSGLSPRDAQKYYPGAIAYVPQEIYLFEGTIKDNILLGYEEEIVSESLIWEALRRAELDKWVLSQAYGLDHKIKETGSNISGGQRQRIGLARALLTDPKLLILDESTSALDRVTEIDIAKTISKLKGKTTVISIAHRPAMINVSTRVLEIVDANKVKVTKKKRKVNAR